MLCQLSASDLAKGWKMGYFGKPVASSIYIFMYICNIYFNSLDICSMYPYVMSTRAFPVGHHRILSNFSNGLPTAEEFSSDLCSSYFGIVKAHIVPPTNLNFPVLPFKHPTTGHLLFPLCKTCATELNHLARCTHESSEERGWTGTFTTMEIEAALKKRVCFIKNNQY